MVQLSNDVLRMFLRNKRLSSLPIYEQYRIRNMIEYWTPKDRAEWNAFMIKLVKKRTCVKYLTDQALLNVIQAARHTIWKQFSRQPEPFDPDVPACYYWNEIECSEWIATNGFPEMREAFLINHITGNKLIALDANAISKMGVKYFETIKAITEKIREILGIPKPNMMRALMRIPPMETFLHKKLYKGRTYDLLTFKKFCENEGFPYEFLTNTDTNARIPATCKLMLHLFSDSTAYDSESSSESNSLAEVPTVEFVTRHIYMRNQIIQEIIDHLVDVVFSPELRSQFDDLVKDTLRNLLEIGWNELGYDEEVHGKERIQFAVDVSKGLIAEMMRTAQVLRDIHKTRKFIQNDISSETYNEMKTAAEILLEAVLPIAALLASGELDLESIFRHEPQFNYYVADIVNEAEEVTSTIIPETESLIDEVIKEAKLKIVSMLFPEIPIDTIRTANDIMENLLDDLLEEGMAGFDEQSDDINRDLDNINITIDDDIESWMGDPLSIPIERRRSKIKRRKFKPLSYKHSEKFDPTSNLPILDRLEDDELDNILQTGKIETKDGTKVINNEILNRAMSEKKRRISTQKQIPQYADQSLPPAQKFDKEGKLLVQKLTDKELDKIVQTGKMVGRDGKEAAVTTDQLDQVRAEKEQRKKNVKTESRKGLQQVHAVKFPGKYTPEGTFQEFTREEKFDPNGMPLLERITVDELENILASGTVESKDGKRIKMDTDAAFIKKVQEETRRRGSLVKQALQQKNPVKYTPEKGFQEFAPDEKFDKLGIPIIDRLTDKELNDILVTGKIEMKDGQQQAARSSLTPQLLQLAQEESNKRKVLNQPDIKSKYVPQADLREYTHDEKFKDNGMPITDRLTSQEIDNILATGKIETKDGRRVSVNAQTLTEIKEERNLRKQLMQTSAPNILQQARQVKYPGKYSDEGTFIPFSSEEMFDSNGKAIIERLTEELLDNIINTGVAPTASGREEVATPEMIQSAQAEKKKREDALIDTQKTIQQQAFQRNYPGEYDSHGVYKEYTSQEKFDPSVGLPILERLNHKELDQLISTGMISSSQGPLKLPPEVLAQAQIEQRRRQRLESIAQSQLESYRRNYPGQIDSAGQFTEFGLEDKVDQNGNPIMPRLNIVELKNIMESQMFYGTPLTTITDTILESARSELEKRKAEDRIAKMRIQIVRNKFPGKVSDGVFEEYRPEEKFDTNGFPIFSRLNTEELDEIIRSGEIPTIDGISTTNETLLQAARNEKFKRQSLEDKVKAEEKHVRNKYLTSPTIYSAENKYDSRGKPILERLTDEELEKVLEGSSDISTDEQVRVIQEQERRSRDRKSAAKAEEMEAINSYQRRFPRSEGKSKEGSAGSKEESAGSKTQLKDIVPKDNLTRKQKRMETLEAIKGVVKKHNEENAVEPQPMPVLPPVVTSTANLAFFNGFVIDHLANVIGTADPFDGRIRDQSGHVLGVITEDGMVFTKEGIALGKLGADVEQIGVGKFRALPKEVDSSEEIIPTTVTQNDGKSKEIPPWNAAQAEIVGGILVKKDNEWVRDTKTPLKNDLEQKTAIALQIQETEGYSPEKIILLVDEPKKAEEKPPAAKVGTAPGKTDKIPGKTDENQANVTEKSLPEEVAKLIEVERMRSQARQNSVKAKTLVAAKREVENSRAGVGGSIRGEETVLYRASKKDLVAVPVPVSSKWGVQTPPENETEPHEFKPPPSLNRPREAEMLAKNQKEESNSQEMLLKVKTGEAKKLVAADGSVVGEIRKDGKITNAQGESVGRVEADGRILNDDGSLMADKGLKVVRPNGVVVGHVTAKGKLAPDREKERHLIGRIWGDGRIVTMENALVGIVTKDGRILGPGGKPIGLFTPSWELLGTDGIPFAYVTSDGKVYRYEVIPQKKEPPAKKIADEGTLTMVKPEKSEAVIIFHKKRSLDFAFELPPMKIPSRNFSLEEKKYEFDEIHPDTKYTDEMLELSKNKAEKERIKKDEEMRKMYDLDESHKRGTKQFGKLSAGPAEQEVGVGTQTDVVEAPQKDSADELRRVSSSTDHRVAKTSQEYLRQKQLHRKELIENWANEVSDLMDQKPDYFTIDPKLSGEEKSRIARMAADNILDDIFKLALTHLLLQAEAGGNTQEIMAALAAIQTTGEGQALWHIHSQEDQNKSKMILKNMISFLPKSEEAILDEQGVHEIRREAPAVAEAGVNTDVETPKDHARKHHRRHRRRQSTAVDISVGKDDDEAVINGVLKKVAQMAKEPKPIVPIKGPFERIINPDEIEQYNQVFDNSGGRVAGTLPKPAEGQQPKGAAIRGRGAPLQHVPHPGVVDKGGKVANKEDVAEQIHQGRKNLAEKEIPIRPHVPRLSLK